VVHETQDESAAQADSLPCIFSGHITQPGQRDRIRFTVEPSVRYRAVVHSRSFGFPLDSVLRVTRVADGSEVVRNDDTARDQYDAEVTWTSKVSDQMELEISDLVDGYGPRHAYSVEISPVQPTAELSVAEEQFTLKAEGTLEISVAISRLGGFEQELMVAAAGLPEGVQAEPVVSKAKGDTSKTVKLKLSANEGVAQQGTFRIVAQANPSDDHQPANFTATTALLENVSVPDLWLTVVTE